MIFGYTAVSNCNLIHNQNICISIANGQFADISDIQYNDINIEYECVDTPILQISDEQIYDGNGEYLPILVNISDNRRNWQGNVSAEDEKRSIKNVKFNNIKVICDKRVIPNINICLANKYGKFENISIDSLIINERLIKGLDLLLDDETSDIVIERKLSSII